MDSPAAGRRRAAVPARSPRAALWRVLAACWPGWGSALGVAAWLAVMVLIAAGWLS